MGDNVSRQELENRVRRSILEISRENDTSIRDDVALVATRVCLARPPVLAMT